MSAEIPAAPVPQALTRAAQDRDATRAPAPAAQETLYEVNVDVDPASAADYDAWLPAHIDRILALPGFLSAEILRRDAVSDGERAGWQRRTVHYRLASARALQDYLDQHAARMRAEAVERFGDRAHFERRVLSQVTRRDSADAAAVYCRNCEAVAPGQYCAACGQRSPVRVLTLWELTREATDDLTHSDSRVWRTLAPLLVKPGQLTREYLLGRRARYLPPFRLYLVLSVVCLVVLGLGRPAEGGFVRFDEKEVEAKLDKMEPAERAGAEEKLAELKTLGNRLRAPPGASPQPAATEGEARESAQPDAAPSEKARCNVAFGSPATRAKLEDICNKLAADNGKQFGEALFHNVPKMMFVFLPLIALVSLLLYAFSGRYYVEHLLFFVHFHAFVFLAFTIQGLFSWIGESFKPFDFVAGIVVLVMVFYFPIYLYKAMRRVYGQGRVLTLIKFFLLSVSYLVCLMLTFIGLVAYTGWTL